MDENQRFFLFLQECYEKFTLLFREYIPKGRDVPDTYRDFLFSMYKLWWSGEVETMAKDPIEVEMAEQTDLFADIKSEKPNGTDVDTKEVETTKKQ